MEIKLSINSQKFILESIEDMNTKSFSIPKIINGEISTLNFIKQ